MGVRGCVCKKEGFYIRVCVGALWFYYFEFHNVFYDYFIKVEAIRGSNLKQLRILIQILLHLPLPCYFLL